MVGLIVGFDKTLFTLWTFNTTLEWLRSLVLEIFIDKGPQSESRNFRTHRTL